MDDRDSNWGRHGNPSREEWYRFPRQLPPHWRTRYEDTELGSSMSFKEMLLVVLLIAVILFLIAGIDNIRELL